MAKTRRTYAAGTSAIALAAVLALAPVPATAQSFQGTGNVVSGIANISTGPGTTTVSVSSPQVVIDWTPTDNATNNGVPIQFQPENTTATFRAFGEYAVLNRIVPSDNSRPIVFSGTVRSQIFENVLRPGGTIYFYSPAGIVLSSTAVFDVGSLGLTTAAPFIDGNGQWILGDAVLFQYANPSSFIHLQRGAQIQAGQEGSYVALFAPVISQSGSINVNGQAALVAAETGTINFSPDGLFDIQVAVGTDGDANGVAIDNQGTITGPASSGPGDNHRIYQVAIPKNELITLLVQRGSNLGFDIAGAAEVEGNAVILSAGHNISAGGVEALTAGSARANIEINDGSDLIPGTGIDFTSAVIASATGAAQIGVTRHTNFASDVTLFAYEGANANVSGSGALLTVGRDLFFQGQTGAGLNAESGSEVDIVGNATFNGNLSFFGAPITGAPIFVGAESGASIEVGGTLFASSWGVGFGGADGTGGRIIVSAANGTIRAGNVSLHSRGQGSDDESTGGTGGGGFVEMSASGTGLLEVLGSTFLLSEGLGGNAFEFGGVGGTGLGDPTGLGDGASTIRASSGGTISLNGSVELISTGQGGSGSDGGMGRGGRAGLFANTGTINVGPETTVFISATGNGGLGLFGNGGNGSGGRADVRAFGGTIALASGTSLQLNASGFGGFGSSGGRGGDGAGGSSIIGAFSNLNSPSLISLQEVSVIADGVGGDGFAPEGSGSGSGGNGTGGFGSVTGSAGNGSVTALSVSAQANGVGGSGGFDAEGTGGAGGSGTGGTLFVGTTDNVGVNPTGSATFGDVAMVADGYGGFGGDGAQGGDGGTGTGGTSNFQVAGTLVSVDTLTMSGSGFGGGGGFGSEAGLGGDGITGGVSVSVTNRNQGSERGSLQAGTIQGFAHAVGGTGLFDGQSIARGGIGFNVVNSDSTVDSLLLETTGDIIDPLDFPDPINVVNGTAQFGSSFAFLSSGIATLQLDNGTLTAPNVELGALRWALPDTAPNVAGTLRATDEFTISAPEASGLPGPLGFETYANFDVTPGLALETPGRFRIGNFTSSAGDLRVFAFESVQTGNIVAESVDLQSNGAIATGSITAGGFAFLSSNEDAVTTGDVAAGAFVDFTAGTDLMTGNITAGQRVSLQAGGNINAGNIDAGSSPENPVSILLSAGGNILAGDLTAPLAINLFSPAGFVTVGDVDTGDFSVDIAGALTTGNIFADNVSLESGQSVATGTISADGFAEIEAGTTVSTGVVNAAAYVDFTAATNLTTSDITAGQKVALQAGGNINAGNIVAGSTSGDPVSILLSAGGDILAGDLTAPLAINLFSPGGFVTVGDVDTGDFSVDISGALTTGNILADNVSLASGQSVTTGTISANGFAEIDSGGAVSTGLVNAAGYVDFTASTDLTTGNITAGQKVALQAGGNINAGNIVAGSTSGDPVSILLSAGGNILAGNLTSPLAINLFSPGGFVTVGDVDTGDFSVHISGALTTGNILADNVSLASGQSVATGTISANGYAEIDSAGSISTGVVIAAAYVDFTAGADIITDNITAGQKVALKAGEDISAGNIVAGSTTGDPVSILLSAGGNILAGNLTSPLAINLFSPSGFVTVGDVDTGDFSVDISGALTTGNILADNVSLASGQSVATGTISANGFAEIDSGGAVSTGVVNAAGFVDFTAGTDISTGNITAGQKVALQAGDDINAGNITAGSTSGDPVSILLSAGGDILAGDLTAPLAINLLSPGGFVTVGDVDTGDFNVDIFGALTTGAIMANNVSLASDQGVSTAAISADGYAEIDSGGAVSTGVVTAAGYVDFTAGTNLTTGNITAGQKVALQAGGNISGGNIVAGSTSGDPVSILLSAGGNILAGNLTAPLRIVATSAGGSLTVGRIDGGDVFADIAGAISTGDILADNLELSSGQSIATGTITTNGYAEIDTAGNLTTGAVNSTAYVDLSAGGNINTGGVTAGQTVEMQSGGTLTTGNISAGSAPGEVFSIGLAAGSNLTTGNLTGPAGIGLLSQTGAIAAGAVNTAGSLLALARTGASFGAVSTGTSSGANLYVADSSMAALGGPLDSFNPGPIFAAAPTPVAGPISFSGPINTGKLTAATNQNFSALGINASIINILAGGLATVGGSWRSDQIFVQSNDIDILAAGLLDGGASGTVRLFSSNNSQMLVGDGLTGSGYALSGAELGRIRAANIFVTARDNSAQEVDLLIGSASVNASQFPSGNGRLVFATLESANATTSAGRIRVNGALAVTGISGEVELELNSDAFELDTSTGSIAMSDGANGLAGRLEINAQNIHVADSAILTLLRADPRYPGHIEELNAPAATQRPEGVLRAENLALLGSDTIYVQNTGTETAPAGFVTTIEGFEVGDESASPGQIEIVLNGQFVTAQGNVSGRDAFRLTFEPANQGVFGDNLSPDSTFNACLIAAGSCGLDDADPIASLSSEIHLLSQDMLSEEPFEQDSEDEEESDVASSPIAPPAPLIDTRPLNPEQDIVEPVAGSGNPALIGSVVNQSTGEEPQQ